MALIIGIIYHLYCLKQLISELKKSEFVFIIIISIVSNGISSCSMYQSLNKAADNQELNRAYGRGLFSVDQEEANKKAQKQK